MPIAPYTLDENDLVYAETPGDRSIDSNSSSMTVVDHTLDELPEIPSDFGDAERRPGALGTEATGRARPDLEPFHESTSIPATPLACRTQRKRQSCSMRSPVVSSAGARTRKAAVARVPLGRDEPACSTALARMGIANVKVVGAAAPLQEFLTSIPQALKRSAEFQSLLKRASKDVLGKKPRSGSESGEWKRLKFKGTSQKDGSLRISVGHLLRVPAASVVDLNIGDVFEGRRFRILKPESLAS